MRVCAAILRLLQERGAVSGVAERHYRYELVYLDGHVRDRRIIQVLQALQRQPDQTPGDLARSVTLSTSRLQHLFKTEMGMTISTYVRIQRLNDARELLATSHLSIKEIRNAIGICDASNFVRQFKQCFGTTPSSYRKRSDSSFNQRIAVSTNENVLRMK